MLDRPIDRNGRHMRKVKVKFVRNTTDRDTMRPHYDFSDAVRGVVAARHAGVTIVQLEPDVATAFPSSAAVNKALRSLIRHPRKSRSKGRARPSKAS